MHKALQAQVKEWRSEAAAKEEGSKQGPRASASSSTAGQWIDRHRHPSPQAEQQRRPRRHQARHRPQHNRPVASARVRAGGSAAAAAEEDEDEDEEELEMDMSLLEEEAAAGSDEGDYDAAQRDLATLLYQRKHGALPSRFCGRMHDLTTCGGLMGSWYGVHTH